MSILFKFIFVLYFSLINSAHAYIDPGFLSSVAMYIFMVFNFLVLIFFIYPKEYIKNIYKKLFKKKNDRNIKKNK
jgi:hypothetical protein